MILCGIAAPPFWGGGLDMQQVGWCIFETVVRFVDSCWCSHRFFGISERITVGCSVVVKFYARQATFVANCSDCCVGDIESLELRRAFKQ